MKFTEGRTMRSSIPERILMTADPIGGVWTYAVELIRALGANGIQIALAAMGGSLTAAQAREIADLPHVTLFESNFRLEWMDDPWEDVDRAGQWLLQIASNFRPDLVHLNGYCHATLPWNVPVVVVAHSCVLSWWVAVKHASAPAKYDRYRERVAAGLAVADEVVAPTAAMRASLLQHYAPPAKIGVIPNGRDFKLFSPAQKKPKVLTAGRVWDEGKNIGMMEAVASDIRWPVEIAGGPSAAKDSAIENPNVRRLGKLPEHEMAKQLAVSSIYALPARYEPFGLSVLESALCGCALVLGDIESLRENWHGAALFADPDDRNAIATAINRLIEDDGLRLKLGFRARARALRFSLQKMAGRYRSCYGRCLQTQREMAA
jgi:glycosyltransferase involved in cell wall biosynthesis